MFYVRLWPIFHSIFQYYHNYWSTKFSNGRFENSKFCVGDMHMICSISQANHLYLTQGSRTINPNFRLKLFYSLIKGISASLCGFSAKRTSSYVTVLRFLKIRNWIKPKIVTAKKIIIQTTISEVTYAGLWNCWIIGELKLEKNWNGGDLSDINWKLMSYLRIL